MSCPICGQIDCNTHTEKYKKTTHISYMPRLTESQKLIVAEALRYHRSMIKHQRLLTELERTEHTIQSAIGSMQYHIGRELQ